LDIPVLLFAKIYDYASYVLNESIHEILGKMVFAGLAVLRVIKIISGITGALSGSSKK
jgi:hypothetical protein